MARAVHEFAELLPCLLLLQRLPPIPQREIGTRHTLHYMDDLVSDNWSILIFPEGVRGQTGTIRSFRGGIGMIASRLDAPVVPVRLDGVEQVLHQSWRMVRPGRDSRRVWRADATAGR